MKKWLIQLLLFMGTVHLSAQSVLYTPITVNIENKYLTEALYILIDESQVDISFPNSIIPKDKVVNTRMENVPLKVVLGQILKDTGLGYKLVRGQVIIFKKQIKPRKKYILSGYIRDKSSGERVIGATLYDIVEKSDTYSNEHGFFSISIYEGQSYLHVSSLGYDTDTVIVNANNDSSLEILLSPTFLTEVVVSSKDSTLLNNIGGKIIINMEPAKNLPSLGGQPDVLRLAYTLPGFQAGADGFGGVSVRGGNVDQNLFLLDGVPIYNASHGIGIFSVYNSSAIQNVDIKKGAFDAKYGGRLSSVWDIQTKVGNSNQFQGEFDIGLSSGTLTFEGPIANGKGSAFFSGRRAFFDFYSEPITRRLRKDRGIDGELGYYFFDSNFKVNYALTDKDRVLFSYYSGRDNFNDVESQDILFGDSTTYILDDEQVTWGNTLASMRWNHKFSGKLFGTASFSFSRYKYDSQNFVELQVLSNDVSLVNDIRVQKYNSEIRDKIIKVDFDYSAFDGHQIEFGGGVTWHEFATSVFNFQEEQSIDTILLDTLGNWTRLPFHSTEFEAYVQDEIRVGDFATLNLGLRLGGMSVGNKFYFIPQPRINVNAFPHESVTINFSINRMAQFLHLLSPSSLGLPKDLWVTSTERIPPQEAWHFQLGGEKRLNHGFAFSTDLYYRKMSNLLVFKESSVENVTSVSWQNSVARGTGRAYGAEFLLKQESPKFGGWIAYTLAWSDRKFPADEVNNGNRFPTRLDRRHNVNLQFLYKFNEKWSGSLGLVYSSGTAFNFPSQEYQIIQPPGGGAPTGFNDTPVQIIDEINDRRMPAYHRMDIAFNRHFWQGETRHSLKFGFYNLYNRKNPLYFTLQDSFNDENQLSTEIIQVSLLPIFPTLRYTLELR